jgi:membrane-associated phospholipid phosphatase
VTAPEAADPLPHRRARQLLLLALACVAMCAVVYLAAVQTTPGQRFDNDALEGRAADRPRVQEATGNLLQTVSVASIVLIGGACVVVALVRRNPLVALGVVVVIAGANVTTQLLKDVLPRPDLVADEVLPNNSYPSGHTTVAISLAVALLLVVPAATRGLAALAGTGYAALIGAGTVTSGWHYPSDPVGAYMVTVAWGAAVAALILFARGRSRRRHRRLDDAPVVGPLFAVVGVGLLLLTFLAIVVTTIALHRGRLDAVDVTRVYGVSLLAIVGVVTLLVSALLFYLRGVRIEQREHLHAAAA